MVVGVCILLMVLGMLVGLVLVYCVMVIKFIEVIRDE